MTSTDPRIRAVRWLTQFDNEQRESRVERMLETEKKEFLGQGFPPPISVETIPVSERMEYHNLEGSMSRIWNEARMSYVYGFFQSSVFQIGAVSELLIEQTLRVKGRWPDYCQKYNPKRRWLGTLIQYCEDGEIVPEDTLQDLSHINELRIAAVHMEAEKENTKIPEDQNPLVELEDISVYAPNRVESKTVLPGQEMLLGFFDGKLGMRAVHMYKPQAMKAFSILSRVFPAMRNLQSSVQAS